MKSSTLASADVLTVQPGDSIDKAISLMDEHAIHHLPVCENAQIVGMISDRDILLSVGGELSSQRHYDRGPASIAGPLCIEEIMARPAITADASTSVDQAARLMVSRRIGAVILTRSDRLVGLLTDTDILRAIRDRKLDYSLRSGLADEPVRQHMRFRVITVKPKDPLSHVVRIFHEKKLRHIPVVTTGTHGRDTLIGIISDRDVRRAIGHAAVCDIQAQEHGDFYIGPTSVMDVVTTAVRTATTVMPIAEATRIMLEYGIHCLPVIVEDVLMGILTSTDILRALAAGDTF